MYPIPFQFKTFSSHSHFLFFFIPQPPFSSHSKSLLLKHEGQPRTLGLTFVSANRIGALQLHCMRLRFKHNSTSPNRVIVDDHIGRAFSADETTIANGVLPPFFRSFMYMIDKASSTTKTRRRYLKTAQECNTVLPWHSRNGLSTRNQATLGS
jgi:hypothetical protein